jgi:membrane-associated phospholipid phosphatase
VKFKHILLSVIALSLAMFACEKELTIELEQADPYTFASTDRNGGNWDPVFFDDFKTALTVPAPAATNSSTYQAELAALKTASANLSPDQEKAVSYWGGNAVLRWNEIAREMAAKYNLAPASNPDGTYGVPSSANPGVYPYFPFANPPYAARAFAYLSAAQFDALIATWHFKEQFKRPAPNSTDPTITLRLPKNDLPSYPSEDAVVAAVATDLLIFLFPLEKELILAKAEEHRQSRLWAGANTASDLQAGDALGKVVAAKFLARAKSDGMGKAGGSKVIYDSLANAAKQKWGWNWVSLETPARPGMLPMYGRVKPWCIPTVEAVRPGPPPLKGTPKFEEEVAEVKRWQEKPTAESRRIANFWADGPGTYTPPGHWNRIAADLIVQKKYNLLRTARTFAYLNMSLQDAGISCWDTKYYYHTPRPASTINGLKTLLGTPNFPAYTSGHSTFSAAAATVLGYIFPEQGARFETLAKEASESRIYGGIHYRSDCEVGLQVGKKIGEYSNAVAKKDGAQ